MRLHTSLNVKYGQPGYSLVAGVGGWGWGGGGFPAVQDE